MSVEFNYPEPVHVKTGFVGVTFKMNKIHVDILLLLLCK